MEREGHNQQLVTIDARGGDIRSALAKMFELLATAETLHESADPEKNVNCLKS
jgi:hypothetical protein